MLAGMGCLQNSLLGPILSNIISHASGSSAIAWFVFDMGGRVVKHAALVYLIVLEWVRAFFCVEGCHVGVITCVGP